MLALALALFVDRPALRNAAPDRISQSDSLEEIDAHIQRQIDRLDIPGLALAIVEGDEIEAGLFGMRKILPYALIGVVGLAIAGLLRQRQRPIPTPPRLTFLFENPLVEAFAGSELLVERLDLAPGMRVLDAGCGPGRLTIPVAKAVEPSGEVVALDCQRKMLELLQHRLEAESITNVWTLEAGLGEGALEREAFDRVLLAFVLGEVRDREAAGHELYAALKPGGILSVTEGFGDPDYRRPASVRHEVEPAGFELVERFGGFPVYTLNFQRPEHLATHKTSPEASDFG